MNHPAEHSASCPIRTGRWELAADERCPACRDEEAWASSISGMLGESSLRVAEETRRDRSDAELTASILSKARGGGELPELPRLEFRIAEVIPLRPLPAAARWIGLAAAAVLAVAVIPRLDERTGGSRMVDPGNGVSSQDPRPTIPASQDVGATEAALPVRDDQASAARLDPEAALKRPSDPPRRDRTSVGTVAARAGGRNASTSIEFRLEKEEDAVRLSWEGNPGERFRVSRCPLRTSGPVCGRGITVEGTSWIDEHPSEEGLVAYRIERAG